MELVSWSLTSVFSTNMAISNTSLEMEITVAGMGGDGMKTDGDRNEICKDGWEWI